MQKIKVKMIVLRMKRWCISMNCRGNKTRKKIVQDYEVKPQVHLKLLANQTKHSDAGATIENEYYIFSAKRKSDGKQETIQCGMGAARDLLKLINHNGLPLFNPLASNNHEATLSKQDNIEKNNPQKEKWNITAKQLYNAIMWLIILWDAKPDTPLFKFKDEVIKYKNNEPFDSKIKRVNTTIRNGGKGKTLTQMINDYREENNIRVSICNFDLLQTRINDMKDENGNIIESYF